MKKLLLSLMLLFGFITTSVDAIESRSVKIYGNDIPEDCVKAEDLNFGDCLGADRVYFSLEKKFLVWVNNFLRKNVYVGITKIVVKEIVYVDGARDNGIDYVLVTVTYRYSRTSLCD